MLREDPDVFDSVWYLHTAAKEEAQAGKSGHRDKWQKEAEGR